jgi:hypothetical protein
LLVLGPQIRKLGAVDEIFELQDPQAAQAFLRKFPHEAQRRGHTSYQEGAVEQLSNVGPGTAYSAIVSQNLWKNEVHLKYEPLAGWIGTCSCPKQQDCSHVYAAMAALLAEHRMTTVRHLSTGQVAASSLAPSSRVQTPGPSESLAERIKAVTGKALTKEEARFLRALHDLYSRCRQSNRITFWDLQQVGLAPARYDWTPLNLWPALPKTEYEFWLYLANYLNEQGIAIPPFMEPVTDLSLIEERLSRWRRNTQIEKWKQVLDRYEPSAPDRTEQKLVDLQVVIDGDSARLAWQRSGSSQFELLKQTQLRSLQSDYYSGSVSFVPEAELIWQLFSGALDYGVKMELDSHNPNFTHALNRLLRAPSLESRVVRGDGKPFVRVREPLRWELIPAENEQDDYRLRLVRADGSAAPPAFCTFPGQPTLYLTEEALFIGPDLVGDVLDASGENRIPAPAVEQPGGLAFIKSIGLELPPRVRDRVRTLEYQVTIHCALSEMYPGSESEECVFTISAKAPDGRQQIWNGSSWTENRAKDARKRIKMDSLITLYDAAPLREVPSLVATLNLKVGQYPNRLSMRVTKKFAEAFSSWVQKVPPHITVELEGELASLRGGEVAGKVKLEVTEGEIDWFDLRVVLDVADTTLSAAEIKLMLNAKGGYVRLQGKGWRRLQYDLTEDENERLARLGLSPRELSAEPQRLHALQLADEAAKKFLPAEQVEQIQRRAGEIKARVSPELPQGITAELRPYQLEGFHFLAYLATNRFGGILADDMGLGKTVQTLAWLIWLRESPPATKERPGMVSVPGTARESEASLVVCPKSVMDNWHAEAAKFAPALRVKIWSAMELGQFREKLDSADVHVLNYSQLRLLGESLVTVHWLAVVLDEGQYIKNPSSQTAQVARALKARHRLVLSGTPIENRLLDLWSLMAFTMPGVLGSRVQFTRLYDAKGDPLARRRLAARVRPFLLRRTKTQVAKELPDRIEEDLFCEIEGEQKALYRAELKAAQQLLLGVQTPKELAQQQFHFLTSLLRLRQICCHPRLIHPDSNAPSAKCESLLEQLEPLMEDGQKVLVFSQFVQMLDLLRPSLEQREWPVFYLAGQTENRGELVKSFQNAEGPAIFLISLKAGGFGLNLTAASYVVLFDPWWNPAVENQAIDRTHRIGQTNKVIAYRLLIKNSIEEKIRALQKQKKALAEDVFGEEKFAQNLSLDDLRFLLSD